MLAIKGIFRNGVAEPAQQVEGQEGQPVLITFLDADIAPFAPDEETAWDALEQLVETCTFYSLPHS